MKRYCITCNKEITSGSRLGRCKSCSRTGELNHNFGKRGQRSYLYNRFTKENAFAYKHGKYIKQYYCKICGKKVCRDCGIRGTGICQSCMKKQLYRIPSNNPNWKGGVSFTPYPLGWNKTFKEQIRYRDGYRCRECGTPEIESGRKLDIHHIDYNKENLKPDNLISLCRRCHSRTQGNKRGYWIDHFKVKEYESNYSAL